LLAPLQGDEHGGRQQHEGQQLPVRAAVLHEHRRRIARLQRGQRFAAQVGAEGRRHGHEHAAEHGVGDVGAGHAVAHAGAAREGAQYARQRRQRPDQKVIVVDHAGERQRKKDLAARARRRRQARVAEAAQQGQHRVALVPQAGAGYALRQVVHALVAEGALRRREVQHGEAGNLQRRRARALRQAFVQLGHERRTVR
jgi:hypothetical protein